VFRLVRRCLLVVVGLVGLYVVGTFVQVWLASRQDDRPRSDAIVVMGAAQYDGVPSPVLASRLDHALELWNEGVAPVVVVTGGRQPGDRFTEATASATYLHSRGVPDSAILREVDGRSSWESLAAVRGFLPGQHPSVVLVSDPFHAKRIEAIAEEVGLAAAVSPTRTSPIAGGDELRSMVRETAGVAVGRLIGFGRLERWSQAAG
jgi:uncharacterized SAM-binding protein YcdF (DUF218 family)